jgi:uncharacterized protein YggU (UPF0235/DUF167 family)
MGALVVSVRPNARRDAIHVVGDAVEVRVTAKPRDGAANAAAGRLLAEALRVPVSSVTLVRGARSRIKTFEVTGLERDATLVRLRTAPE